MISIFHQISSFVLAFVLLCSTTTITIHKHYCFNRLVKVSISTENAGCKMMNTDSKSESSLVEKPSCCSDKQLVVESIDNLQFEKYVPEFEKTSFYIQTTSLYEADYTDFKKLEHSSYFKYRPPPLVKSIYRLDQKYLI